MLIYKMKRLVPAAAGLILLLGTAAYADSPHFISASGVIDPATGDYTCSWKEAGLGKTSVTLECASANASSEWQCFTKSGNNPQGQPQAGGVGDIVATGTFTPHNGSITGSLSLTPEVGTAHCQGGGLKLCLTSVSYVDVSINDETSAGTPSELLPSLNASFPAPTSKTNGLCQ